MHRKTTILCLWVLLISLAGCDNTPNQPAQESPERIVLGFSQLGDESEWRTSASNDIKRAADDHGIQLIFEDAQQKQFNQLKAIRSFILNRVDVIAFSPVVEEGWDNILQEARAAGIPVILADRYIHTEEENLYTAFLGADFEREGFEAGKWIIKKFMRTQGPIKVAEIRGTDNSSPVIGRHDGLLKAFAYSDKFQLVSSVSGDFMRSKGREGMETILEEAPDFDVLFAHNDDMALGAIEILEERGIKPGKDVVIVSVDAQKSGLAALKEGKINCLIECNPYMGDELMELVEDIAKDVPVPGFTFTELRVFTEDDDPDSLPNRTH